MAGIADSRPAADVMEPDAEPEVCAMLVSSGVNGATPARWRAPR